MNQKLDRRFLPLILTSLVVLGIPSCICQNNDQYQTCRETFQCGRLRDISYPFYGGNRPVSCGYPGFELICQGDDDPRINISSITYRVLATDNSTHTLRVSRNDLQDDLCQGSFSNTTLNFALFDFYPSANDQNITLYYGCPFSQTLVQLLVTNYIFNCSLFNPDILNFFVTSQPSEELQVISAACRSHIYVPVNQSAARELANPTIASGTRLQTSLESGFSIQYLAHNDNCNDCVGSGGFCGYNQTLRSFACHCINGTFQSTCNGDRTGNGTYE